MPIMSVPWPTLSYPQWQATCDTLHAHTQVLGKLAGKLAPPEPQLQHAALRLTARGWETLPLPAPDRSGSLSIRLDLHTHEAVAEHSDGRTERSRSTPEPPGGRRHPGRAGRGARAGRRGGVRPHPAGSAVDGAARRRRRARQLRRRPGRGRTSPPRRRPRWCWPSTGRPFRGRSTPVNAWWGSFDLAVSLFSGRPAEPPSQDFIMRNAMDAQEVAVGWWPGDPGTAEAGFYAYAHPAVDGFSQATLAARRRALGRGPGRVRPELGRRAHGRGPARGGGGLRPIGVPARCRVCAWDPALAATANGTPPPVR